MLLISYAIVTSCVTISNTIVTLIIIIIIIIIIIVIVIVIVIIIIIKVKTVPLETHTFQVIFSFRPGYFEQLPPRLSKETKRIYLFLFISVINCKTSTCHSPAISPFKSSFRFSAASSLVSVSFVCCWYFSASVLAAVRFSLSDEI